jgi:arginase
MMGTQSFEGSFTMKPANGKHISIIGVPMNLGADRLGVDLGPVAIRHAGIKARLERIGYKIEDRGDLTVVRPESATTAYSNLKYLDEIVRVNSELCETVADAMAKGSMPLVLGGDHSIAIGTMAGVMQHKKNLGVIWFDAHGDLNTAETSPSGNIHGMPVAVALGIGHERLTAIGGSENKLNPKHLVLIGSRDLDAGERKLLKDLGVTVFSMHEIDLIGITKVMEDAIKIASDGTDGVHVSFDMDAMDPVYAIGTGTRVPGGLTYRECHLALELIAQSGIVTSAEFVEVNPLIDNKNETAESAVVLMGSLLGEWLK